MVAVRNLLNRTPITELLEPSPARGRRKLVHLDHASTPAFQRWSDPQRRDPIRVGGFGSSLTNSVGRLDLRWEPGVRVPFGVGREPVKLMGIFAHDQVGEQRHLGARRRQVVERAHRHVELVTYALHVHQDLRRALLDRSDAFMTTVVQKLLVYALGRPVGTVKTWLHRARLEILDRLRRRGLVTEVGHELP